MKEEKDILDSFKKRSIETPDSKYFDDLASSIISKNKSEAKIIPFYKKPITWLSTAAAAIVILFIIPFNTDQEFDIAGEFDKIPEVEVKSYLEEQSIAFDDEFIFETFNLNSIEKNEIFDELLLINSSSASVPSTVLDFTEIQNQDIQEFLMDEGYELADQETIFI